MKRLALILIALITTPSFAVNLPPVPTPKPTADKRSKPVEAQPLPGLGVLPGIREEQKTNVIRVSSDRNEIVYVSYLLPNRISTPFADPQSIDQQKQDADISPVGQSLYVTMKNPEKPVVIYVTGSEPNDPVISLTLVPKDIAPQTIVLQLDKAAAGTNGKGEADHAPESNVYTDQLRYVLREAALGKTPEGFSEGNLPASVASIGSVIAYPKVRYSGPNYDIYRYTLEGTTDADEELDEGTFYTDGVRAVSFFPTSTLRKGARTSVFIVSDKSATELN